VAARVLEIADAARSVAGVDVLEARRARDLGGANEHLRRRVLRIRHAVVLVERRHVPGNVRRHRGHEPGQLLQLVGAVVEARDQERHDLDPHAHLVQTADRERDRLEPSAKLSVLAVVEALEIHLVEVDVGTDEVEDAPGPVAVRDERRHQPGRARMTEDLDGPLGGDQGLVVRRHDDSRALPHGIGDEQVRDRFERRRDRTRIAQGLRRHPVLAIGAVQIAAEHPERVGERARMGMEEGFLFDRIALDAADVAPRHVQPSALDEPYLAHARRPFGDRTLVAAGVAAKATVRDALDEIRRGLSGTLGQDFCQRRHGNIVRPSTRARPRP